MFSADSACTNFDEAEKQNHSTRIRNISKAICLNNLSFHDHLKHVFVGRISSAWVQRAPKKNVQQAHSK